LILSQAIIKQPFEISNIRLFVAFRVFFNARFYYPVFAILFLDFGLTLEQFALLNVVWALTIVILEVPSGALADTIGRRSLLVSTGVLMVLEMALLCFAPRTNPRLLFAFLLVNRVLSGTAEAAASGADEALAYDSLKKEGDVAEWDKVLEKQMRFQSIGFIVAMIFGAAVYDPELMTRFANWLGFNILLSQGMTLRFPLLLTLAMAIMVLGTTLRMEETRNPDDVSKASLRTWRERLVDAMKTTLQAGQWILKTPFALVIISAGLILDHVIRMIMTLSSEYFRLIQLPEASFGLIGSGLAVLGLFVPRIAMKLAQNHTPLFNLGILLALALMGLMGLVLFVPYYGLFPIILLFSVFFMSGFFVSHYLNRITNSDQRATVLSFKGLSLNLAYGAIGLLYSLFVAGLRSNVLENGSCPDEQGIADVVFYQSLKWSPVYFIAIVTALLLFARWKLRYSQDHKRIG
jgi:MFS family permease